MNRVSEREKMPPRESHIKAPGSKKGGKKNNSNDLIVGDFIFVAEQIKAAFACVLGGGAPASYYFEVV